mgnify:CR=1 FL=1
MEIAAGLIKLKPNMCSELREWRDTLQGKCREVRACLREEGVALEAWFEIEIKCEPYLLWVMQAKSVAEARRVFMNSTREIDAFHLEKMMRIGDDQIEARLLIDMGRTP